MERVFELAVCCTRFVTSQAMASVPRDVLQDAEVGAEDAEEAAAEKEAEAQELRAQQQRHLCVTDAPAAQVPPCRFFRCSQV